MRIVRFLFRNWPLKLGAILLAIMLYVAMVALQNAQVWPGQVPIDPINQPATAVLLDPNPLPLVSNIRYVAPPDVAASVTKDSFRATVDLSQVKVTSTQTSQLVKVELVSNDDRIQILDYTPQQIRVTLDPLVHKTVAVKVGYGQPAAGLTVGTPVATPSQADVFGPRSIVSLVAAAQARVGIDASGLDVDQTVDLVALDARGTILNGVEFDPRTVNVRIQVGSQLRTATLPVYPVIVDAPAAGFYVASIEVTPPIAQIQGEADALALLKGRVATKPVSIAGATSDVTAQVALDLPNGVEAPAIAKVKVVVHLQSPSVNRTYSVAIAAIGARPDRVYSLSTTSLLVTIGGPTAALNALDPSTIVGSVDVSGMSAGPHNATVAVGVPPGLKIVSQSLSQIVVTVSAAATPPPSPSASPTPGPSPT